MIELSAYPDQDSVQRQEILIEQLRKAGMTLKFNTAPVAEAGRDILRAGEEELGPARRLDRPPRSEPDLLLDCSPRMPTSTRAVRRCRRSSTRP